MAGTSAVAPREVFEEMTYDVTDTGCQICCYLMCPCTWIIFCPGVMGTKKLILEPEEAVFTTDYCLGCHTNTRRPYGELGSVDVETCLCCVGFKSGFTGDGAIFPKYGCDQAFVEDIVAEMKKRMKSRGDTGQMKRAEENTLQLVYLHAKMDAIMAHLQIPAVPAPTSMEMEGRA